MFKTYYPVTISINRNILECKYIYCHLYYTSIYVLIETYWNVNYKISYVKTLPDFVLIETYWNVNSTALWKFSETPSEY